MFCRLVFDSFGGTARCCGLHKTRRKFRDQNEIHFEEASGILYRKHLLRGLYRQSMDGISGHFGNSGRCFVCFAELGGWTFSKEFPILDDILHPLLLHDIKRVRRNLKSIL